MDASHPEADERRAWVAAELEQARVDYHARRVRLVLRALRRQADAIGPGASRGGGVPARADARELAPRRADACELVSRATAAFNARHLEKLLAVLAADVELRPLRPSEQAVYRGHAGVARWFGDLERHGRDDRIVFSHLRPVSHDRVIAVGRVEAESVRIALTAVHDFRDGLITSAQHYFSDEKLLRSLGYIH